MKEQFPKEVPNTGSEPIQMVKASDVISWGKSVVSFVVSLVLVTTGVVIVWADLNGQVREANTQITSNLKSIDELKKNNKEMQKQLSGIDKKQAVIVEQVANTNSLIKEYLMESRRTRTRR